MNMKTKLYKLYFAICITTISLSYISCDPPKDKTLYSAIEKKMLLFGNNTTDTLVMIFEDRNSSSILYYHFYEGIENDSSFIEDMDDDNLPPFWNETDSEGRYLHWQIMLPFSNVHVLPRFFVICDFNMTRYLSLPDSLQIYSPKVQIGVIRYSKFEEYGYNKDKIVQADVLEHYEFMSWTDPENPKDGAFIYNGTGNVITNLYGF